MAKEWKSSTDLEAHLDRVGNEAMQLRYNQPDQAVNICLEALEDAAALTDGPRSLKNQIARLKLVISGLYVRTSNYDLALSQALEAHAIYEDIQLPSGIARSLSAVGLAYLHLGRFAEGLGVLLQALSYATQSDDARLKALVYNNLGMLYLRTEEYPKALSYLEQGLDLAEKTNSYENQADLLENLCMALMEVGKYSEALGQGQKSITLYQNASNRFGEAKALSTIGEVYQVMGHPFEAINYFQKSLELSQEIEFTQGIANSFYLIGNIESQQGDNEKAISNLTQALVAAQDGQDPHQIYRSHLALSKVYRAVGEHEKALAHYELYHQEKEAVFSDDMTTKIKSLEVLHQVQQMEQDAEIYRLKNVELSREIDERKKVQAELERIVTLDPLTNLFNRRHFFELAQIELARSQRYGRPLSVIMLDIDHFKLINDRFGHLIGDKVLIEIAQRIKKALRRVDMACRYGGEEFAIMLPETALHQAEIVANRLWRIVTTNPAVTGELQLKVGISVGIASTEQEQVISIDALLDHADQAMYAAKDAGRNRVMLYSKEMGLQRNSHSSSE